MGDSRLDVLEDLSEIPAEAWNRVSGTSNPFIRHEFLAALERQGCLGERYGWLPRHLVLRGAGGRLLGAAPLYLKDNSYGEFVFDWSWAHAYERAGLAYYPKLVSAVPYSPVTGRRLLVDPEVPAEPVRARLIDGALELAGRLGVSSLHWLFPTGDETERLETGPFLRRIGCQFHWANQGYGDFEDFLSALNAQRRKKIKRERRKVAEAGVVFRLLDGHQATEAEWDLFHSLYASTFHRRGGVPTLSPGFFKEIAATMGEQVLLVLADHGGRTVAGAFCLVGEEALFGRHWGCTEDFDGLHFEACYYQGIEYCIRRGLRRFEPGAQGEHKIWRGFLPTCTWSAHWIADPRFREGVERFLRTESEAMADYMDELSAHSPYRVPDGAGSPG
jgi:predicted N-acyltransferase